MQHTVVGYSAGATYGVPSCRWWSYSRLQPGGNALVQRRVPEGTLEEPLAGAPLVCKVTTMPV